MPPCDKTAQEAEPPACISETLHPGAAAHGETPGDAVQASSPAATPNHVAITSTARGPTPDPPARAPEQGMPAVFFAVACSFLQQQPLQATPAVDSSLFVTPRGIFLWGRIGLKRSMLGSTGYVSRGNTDFDRRGSRTSSHSEVAHNLISRKI